MATVSSGSTTLVDYRGADAWGNSTEEVYGNGVATVRGFAAATGRLESIATSRGTGPSAATMQADAYAWRSDGSLHSRTSGGTTETFAYDALNRLTSATTDLAADRVLSYDYDPRGNLESKTSSATADADVTGYSYGAADNRLDEVRVRGAMRTLHYDQSGHVTRYEAAGDDRFVEWDGRGLATEVRLAASATAATSTALDAQSSSLDTFAYGPDGARFHRRSEWKEGDATRTEETYYAGRHEKTYRADGSIVERTRIGTAVVHARTTPAPDANGDRGPSTSSFEYLHRDHLGSVRSVTDESGAELAVLAHDPYGGRRRTDWTAGLTAASSTALVGTHGRRVSRGFTGHEHLDRTGLVHMNGRVYDPQLGRFLSPDPVVADPGVSQGWNLYSYVGNNPLSRTDPTGLIQAGAMCNISTYVFCMDGGGGGGAARTATVTTTAHVFGVHVYHTPVWRSDWEWVWVPSFESGRFVVVNRGHYEWISQVVPYSATVQSSRQVVVADNDPASEPTGAGNPPAHDRNLSDLKNEVEARALELVEERMKTGFETQDKAALFLHKVLYPLSRKYDVEVGARIYTTERIGRWFVTSPYTDGKSNKVRRRDVPDNARGGNAGVWHTHPSGNRPGPLDTVRKGAENKSLYVSHLLDGEPVLSEFDDLTMDWFEPME